MQLKLVHIDKELFDEVLQSQAGVGEWSAPPEKPPEPEKALEYKAAPRLDPLLKRMVAEGASDLHLSAKRPPRWRIDGELHLIQDVKEIGSEEVLEILNPVLDKHEQLEFKASWNTDFSYTLPGVARFRGNIFRDEKGIGTVLRMIPDKILSLEQLGLPLVIKKLCEKPKGLVLVTGPAGSGKSTTLAAMIDDINTTRYAHIITMEDPIEFVHKEECALINQRQIGLHTPNYATAIRAALREDPDIILIGELRDRETIALALEAANTGSLVFGTLHTATAINTVARIIDFFPSDQHKHIRSSLCDSLEGIISQTLCKRIGGGRVAAVEVLIVNTAVNNLIREEKTNQIASIMQSTGKTQGHRLLNEELTRLVKRKKVRYEEALSKTPEPEDLARRLGKRLPKD